MSDQDIAALVLSAERRWMDNSIRRWADGRVHEQRGEK
jgi:hypothetical protein